MSKEKRVHEAHRNIILGKVSKQVCVCVCVRVCLWVRVGAEEWMRAQGREDEVNVSRVNTCLDEGTDTAASPTATAAPAPPSDGVLESNTPLFRFLTFTLTIDFSLLSPSFSSWLALLLSAFCAFTHLRKYFMLAWEARSASYP